MRDYVIEGARHFILNTFRWSFYDIDSDVALERRLNDAIDSNETLTAHLHGQHPFTVSGLPVQWEATSTGGGDAHFKVSSHLVECDHDESRATCKRSTCPECGPHGGNGRVLLLDSWVDCLTCKPEST